jgi:hypothetical protein
MGGRTVSRCLLLLLVIRVFHENVRVGGPIDFAVSSFTALVLVGKDDIKKRREDERQLEAKVRAMLVMGCSDRAPKGRSRPPSTMEDNLTNIEGRIRDNWPRAKNAKAWDGPVVILKTRLGLYISRKGGVDGLCYPPAITCRESHNVPLLQRPKNSWL